MKKRRKTTLHRVGYGTAVCLLIKLKYVLEWAHQLIDFADYADLFNKYDTLTKIFFDYAMVEHELDIVVMRFNSEWKDLGTWNTLTEAVEEQLIGDARVNDKFTNVPGLTDLLFVPQTVDATYKIVIRYFIGTEQFDKEILLSEFKKEGSALETWAPGNKYTYQLIIGPNPILFDISGVTDWTDGGTYTYTIE